MKTTRFPYTILGSLQCLQRLFEIDLASVVENQLTFRIIIFASDDWLVLGAFFWGMVVFIWGAD